MKRLVFVVVIFLVGLFHTTCFGQKVSYGIDAAGLPFQIYGGHFRSEPSKGLYFEAFGSYRPLKERSAGLGSYKREGTVFDISLGYQKIWEATDYDFRMGIGPYFQRKKFTGEEQCGGFSIFGCGQLFPERISPSIIGLRLGMTFILNDGLYFHGYGGLGISNNQTENELRRAREERGISIEHSDAYMHARLVVGWQFDLRKSEQID